MRKLVLYIDESKYALFVRFLQTLDYIKVRPLKTVDADSVPANRYDFSDLAGKLQWNGNAMSEQRRLRDEW